MNPNNKNTNEKNKWKSIFERKGLQEFARKTANSVIKENKVSWNN